MRSRKAHFILAAFLLMIFSIGTAYDACAYTDSQLESGSQSSSLSSDSSSPSSSFDFSAPDCHCLCHFAFQPVNNVSIKIFTRHQSFDSLLKAPVKEPALAGILRPPMLLL